MSAEENKTVVRRFFEEFCNQRRSDLANVLMTQDSRYIDPQMPGVPPGPQAMADAVAIYQNGVEGYWEVSDIFAADDNRVVALWSGTGRHTGDVMGITPTGQLIRVSWILRGKLV